MSEPHHTNTQTGQPSWLLGVAIVCSVAGAALAWFGATVLQTRIGIATLLSGAVLLVLHLRRRESAFAAELDAAQRATATADELKATLQRAEAAEAARSDLVQRLTMAMNAAGISMWDWDIKTDVSKIMEGSAFAERMGGRTEYMGAEYQELVVHPDDRAAWPEVFAKGLTQPPGQDLFSHRYRALYPDGSTHWIQFHCRIIRNSRGLARRVIGVDWDVTKEVQAAEEIAAQARKIAEAESRLQRAVGGTQDALFDLRLDGKKSWIAPRFYTMLGYQEREFSLSAEWWNSIIHPDDLPRRLAALQAHLQRNEPFDVEYRLRKKDGSWLWVRARGVASAERDDKGRPLIFSGGIQDITEARTAREKLIEATRAAEEASRAKSAFLATMSHEIRTPMNGIIGMTTLLLDSALNKVQRDYAQTVLASADSLLSILNDILDFSKIEAGKMEIERIEMDLVATVEDIGALMAFQCAAKNLELIVNIRPDVPEWIIADPQRIRQCLLNLVGNAIKFTQQGEVLVDVFTVGQHDGNTLIQFEVRDTGLGIEPEALSRLFQPFTQADSSTTRKFGGTGLGLSIVRRLIDLMGGQVGAQSEPGKGSLFWFTLPCQPSAIKIGDGRRVVEEKDAYRVLVVDDNETNRRVLTGQLLHAGYEVESVSSGADALGLMRQRAHLPFDLVLLDFEMPEMDGAALGEAIMDDLELSRTRLVMLTSLDRSGDIQRFADIGFAAYLAKPIRSRELLRCLHKVLGYEADAWQSRSQPMITRSGLMVSDGARYEGKVLLVEDNVINQRVASRFLERLGCEVDVVDDGAKAVSAFDHNRYKMILMDMQMPVMDGLEATRRIRAIEKRRQLVRTPIVALTANAHTGQMELCLEAGMDDYLTKPLEIERLHTTLENYMKDGGASIAQPASSGAPSRTNAGETTDETASQFATIKTRIDEISGGDAEFAAELIAAFVASGDEALSEMGSAIAGQDLSALGRAAHKLKGAGNNMHMHRLGTLAHDIELNAKANAQRNWGREIDQLAREFAATVKLLRQLAPDASTPADSAASADRTAGLRNAVN